MSQIVLKKFLRLNKVKNTVSQTYFINDFNGEEVVETFYEKELQKTNQNKFRVNKSNKKKKQ